MELYLENIIHLEVFLDLLFEAKSSPNNNGLHTNNIHFIDYF